MRPMISSSPLTSPSSTLGLLAPMVCFLLVACAGSEGRIDGGPVADGAADSLQFTDGSTGDVPPSDTAIVVDTVPGADLTQDGPGMPDAPGGDLSPCVPQCGGKACGDDGCGGQCGSCAAWQICASGQCVCDETLPSGWPAGFTPWSANPVMVPTAGSAMHGSDNIYAPEIHPLSGGLVMWYGAQGGAGHDRIFVATSRDGAQWRKWPSDQTPQPVLDLGTSNHVNDPSVVWTAGGWNMYYTDAAVGIDDTIWLAQGTSLTAFAKVAQVLGPGSAGSWESLKVGRPAVLLEGGEYRMWYDGQDGSARHVGYATSSDGKVFIRHPDNPVFLNAGAVDVKRVGGVYVMVHEGQNGTNWASSKDGIHCWKDRGQLFGKSGSAYDAFGQVTPFLQVTAGQIEAVWFGGASVSTWNRNRIAAAFPAGIAGPPGAGCTACVTAGLSCSAACQEAGADSLGTCGAPGSTNPGACCACNPEGCEGCVGNHADCHAACVASGAAGGWCANPGSSVGSVCCACWN